MNCAECGRTIHHLNAHYPHEPDCPRSNGEYVCECDTPAVCGGCCHQCSAGDTRQLH